MQLSFHSMAVVLTPVQTKQIRINIHKRNNTKNTVQINQNRVNTSTHITILVYTHTHYKQVTTSTVQNTHLIRICNRGTIYFISYKEEWVLHTKLKYYFCSPPHPPAKKKLKKLKLNYVSFKFASNPYLKTQHNTRYTKYQIFFFFNGSHPIVFNIIEVYIPSKTQQIIVSK